MFHSFVSMEGAEAARHLLLAAPPLGQCHARAYATQQLAIAVSKQELAILKLIMTLPSFS
jgi:hypothetical protein